MKSRDGKSQRREEKKKEDQKRESLRKKEDPGARKGRKAAKQCVLPMICGSGWSKSRLAKAAGAEPSGQMRDEKLHAVVAQSTCPSQNARSTPGSDHFWKLRCGKLHTPLWTKHISKSKAQKLRGTEHFWTFRCRFSWQAQGIVHLVKSEQNWRVL